MKKIRPTPVTLHEACACQCTAKVEESSRGYARFVDVNMDTCMQSELDKTTVTASNIVAICSNRVVMVQ